MPDVGCRLPPRPRAVLYGVVRDPLVLVPAMDDSWRPIENLWALPGRAVLTTDELHALATARGWVCVVFT